MKRFAAVLASVVMLCAAAPSPTMRDILVAERTRTLDDLVAQLDGPPLVAARAALAMGRTKDRRGAPALRARIAAPEPVRRAMVAYALGLLADATSLPALLALAKRDPSGAVRYAAVDAIGRIAAADPRSSVGAETDILEVLGTDGDATVRGHAAANVDAFRGRPTAQRIAFTLQRAFRRERDEAVRWHIMWTLSRAFPTLTSGPFFAQALHDRSDIVRLEAVRGLGRGKDVRAAALVGPLLDDSSWRVQEEAAEALRRLRGQAPTAHLAQLQSGLHLPAASSAPAHDVTPLPHVSPAANLSPPGNDDARLEPALSPTTSSLMNGPMPGRHPRVRIETSKGIVVIRLYPEWAPYTVANFLNLAKAGFFDGNRWFRIVPDFVVQTGDRTNTGEGDAGYTIGAEENPIEQRAGVISMGLEYDEKTNTPKRDSAGSQFYITLSPQLHLDRDFTVFGEVASGFNVLAHLIEADTIRVAEQIADG